jgi:hypothetical protein
MDVTASPALAVGVAPAYASSLGVARGSLGYSLSVVSGADSMASSSTRSRQALTPPAGRPRAWWLRGSGTVNVTLPVPVSTTLTATATRLASPTSAAAAAGIGWPPPAPCRQSILFANGATKVMTADPRVRFTVVAGSQYASLAGNVLTVRPGA